MNTKNNQRTRLSKQLLKNAMMVLLQEKGNIEKISVRELCERAELNRSTFYAHYNEPKDLLNEIENELLDSTKEHLKKIGEEDSAGAHKYILSFLEYIKRNGDIFRILLVDCVEPEFRTKFMQQSVIQFMENIDIVIEKETEQYVYSYILNGSTGVITQWIRSNFSIPESELMDFLFQINLNALIKFLK